MNDNENDRLRESLLEARGEKEKSDNVARGLVWVIFAFAILAVIVGGFR